MREGAACAEAGGGTSARTSSCDAVECPVDMAADKSETSARLVSKLVPLARSFAGATVMDSALPSRATTHRPDDACQRTTATSSPLRSVRFFRPHSLARDPARTSAAAATEDDVTADEAADETDVAVAAANSRLPSISSGDVLVAGLRWVSARLDERKGAERIVRARESEECGGDESSRVPSLVVEHTNESGGATHAAIE